MSLAIETIDPLRDERWQPFVEASEDASIFHHRDWLALLQAQYGYPMLAHCVVAPSAGITAALPLAHVKSRLTGSRLVALPFSDVCGPVTRAADEGAVEMLMDAVLRQHRRENVDVEIRTPVAGLGQPGTGFHHHTVPLGPDVEAIRRGFDSQVRRRVSRAAREGVEVVRHTGREALDDFYRLHLASRRRQGVPVQPRGFIRRLADLFEGGLGFVLLARFEEQTIAANVFLAFNGVLIGKYNASDPVHLQKGPNNALLMEAIRWGCANGYRTFDLGRTDLDNEGLRSFKRGWGAEERTLTYTRLSLRQTSSSHEGVPRFARSFLRRTPPITTRLVGAALYKHFG